jgi:hypothetical protein
MNEVHQKHVETLKSGSFDAIVVRRRGKECWLMIEFDGKLHVYLNQFGKCPRYHHVWQIRKWLNETFGIQSDQVKVLVDDDSKD